MKIFSRKKGNGSQAPYLSSLVDYWVYIIHSQDKIATDLLKLISKELPSENKSKQLAFEGQFELMALRTVLLNNNFPKIYGTHSEDDLMKASGLVGSAFMIAIKQNGCNHEEGIKIHEALGAMHERNLQLMESKSKHYSENGLSRLVQYIVEKVFVKLEPSTREKINRVFQETLTKDTHRIEKDITFQ